VGRSRRLPFLLAAALVALVLAVYAQTYWHGFVEYDDLGYVRDNSVVRRGLTLYGVRWALTTGQLGNWIPLTWLSYMLDVRLFGISAGALHLVNVGLHLANTLLLFAVLLRMSGATWPSFAVAALFGIHPLHVESVAWIAERKDVLSTFFWFLCLWAYARYADTGTARWYAALLGWFALGLMAKPMLVTLPFVLLLLDLWPLGRFAPFGALPAAGGARPVLRAQARRAPTAPRSRAVPMRTLVWEKAPLLLLSAVASAVAVIAQQRSGAITSAERLPVGVRVANAIVAYVRYLLMAIWPADLAVLYPYGRQIPAWQVLGAALILALVSAVVLRGGRRHPYAVVGWLWYLVTLVPVIGLVQIGSQAYADRYTYVPLVGIFVALAWGVAERVGRRPIPAPAVGAALAAILGIYAAVAWAEVGRWHDGVTLLSHTVRVTRDNPIAQNNLGVALGNAGEPEAALEHFQAALRSKPDYAHAHNNLGRLLWRQGRREDAAAQYRLALRDEPDSAETHNNLGVVLTEVGRLDEAIEQLSAAIALDPEFGGAYFNLGNALRDSGQPEAAIARYREAIRIRPDNAQAYNNLGLLLWRQGRREDALQHFRAAVRLAADSTEAQNNLGLLLAQMGETDAAIEHLREAVRLTPEHADTHLHLGNALRTADRLGEAIAEYEAALRLDPAAPDVQAQLATALTLAGRSADALPYFERGLAQRPDDAQLHNDYGVALMASDQLEPAIRQFHEALRLEPALPDAQVNLDFARSVQNDASTARHIGELR